MKTDDHPSDPKPSRQLRINFVRGEQLGLLKHLAFPLPITAVDPATDLVRVVKTSQKAMIAVLRAIDDVCSLKEPTWRLKIATIGHMTGMSTGSVKRALRALVALRVLIVLPHKERGWSANEYGIDWQTLLDFDTRQARTEDGERRTEDGNKSFLRPPSSVLRPSPPQSQAHSSPTPAACQPAPPTDRSPLFFAPQAKGHSAPTEGSQRTDRRVTVTRPIGHSDPSSLTPSSIENSKRAVSTPGGSAGALKISEGRKTYDHSPTTLFLAERIVRALRIRKEAQADVSLAVKTAKLVELGQVTEHQLHTCLEAVRVNSPIQNPPSYFHTCLDAQLGGDLNRLLARLGEV